ncbi:uncharacterized protein LOC135933997 [Cloeon dipterum]|uniref:uncharacterized protein LOC135933997 n=1 Tax=Cloeon dipterum TaxID=197152 RepID=UPI00321F8752
MVVAEKSAANPKASNTMLWVQTSPLQVQCEVHEKGTEWYYIPRPSLSSRASSRRDSEDNSDKHSWSNTSRHSSLGYSTHPGVHGNGGASSSSTSSASSQLSGNSGHPLVTAPTWLPPHPPALIVKDEIHKQDVESGGEIGTISKRCDGDSISLASSTHFTMIGGVSVKGRRRSRCCSQSHRITVLVLTMSFIFLLGITIACILMEMRVKEYNAR